MMSLFTMLRNVAFLYWGNNNNIVTGHRSIWFLKCIYLFIVNKFIYKLHFLKYHLNVVIIIELWNLMLRHVRDWMFFKLANFRVRSKFKLENGLSKLSKELIWVGILRTTRWCYKLLIWNKHNSNNTTPEDACLPASSIMKSFWHERMGKDKPVCLSTSVRHWTVFVEWPYIQELPMWKNKTFSNVFFFLI